MMIKKHIIFLFTFSTFLFSSEIKNKCIDVINSYYSENVRLVHKEFIIKPGIKSGIEKQVKQRFFRDKIHYWVIENSNGLNYALLDNSIGKVMPITYLVIFNNKMEVVHSRVIKYREAYGGEVSGRKWLGQFNGMTSDSAHQLGREIDGISGATLSVRSMIKGINKLSLLLPYIIEDYSKVD